MLDEIKAKVKSLTEIGSGALLLLICERMLPAAYLYFSGSESEKSVVIKRAISLLWECMYGYFRADEIRQIVLELEKISPNMEGNSNQFVSFALDGVGFILDSFRFFEKKEKSLVLSAVNVFWEAAALEDADVEYILTGRVLDYESPGGLRWNYLDALFVDVDFLSKRSDNQILEQFPEYFARSVSYSLSFLEPGRSS